MSRTAPPAGRIVLSAALLLSGASLAAAPSSAPPAAAPAPAAKKPAAPPAAPSASAEKIQASHSIGLSLARPLHSKLKKEQLVMAQVAKGLNDALGGKELTDEQQESVQAFVRDGSGDRNAASYNMGLAMGQPLHAAFLGADSLSVPDIVKGLSDALDGAESTPDSQSQALAYMTKNKQTIADKNHAKAEAFLADNKNKPGVKTTASGLQYKILAPGSGDPPKPTDTVSVRYTGKLLDGKEFDGTDQRNNEPAAFPVNHVIQGWQEALVLMKPGAKYELYIPPALAYDLNSEDPIPPGSLLVFTVELLKVQSAGK